MMNNQGSALTEGGDEGTKGRGASALASRTRTPLMIERLISSRHAELNLSPLDRATPNSSRCTSIFGFSGGSRSLSPYMIPSRGVHRGHKMVFQNVPWYGGLLDTCRVKLHRWISEKWKPLCIEDATIYPYARGFFC